MHTKTMLAALLAFPLLITGCNNPTQSPTSSIAGEDKQAAATSSPDKTMESAPPAAGLPQSAGSQGDSTQAPPTPPVAPAAPDTSASPQGGAGKSAY